MPKIIDATKKASSTINTNRDAIQKQIQDLKQKISNNQTKQSYLISKINYHDQIISNCDSILALKGFHPIQKHRASITKFKEKNARHSNQIELNQLKTREISLQAKIANLEIEDKQTAFKNENTGFLQKRTIGSAKVQIKDGKIDFSSKEGKKLTENLFDPQSGEPTANFETLKQVLVDYPKSITTLPDNVVQQLNNSKVTVRIPQAHGNLNGQNIFLVYDKQMTGFEYMKGMASAGMKIAEQQGREAQCNPDAKVEFADWVKEKENMLNPQTKTNTNTATKQYNPNEAQPVF